MNKSFQVEPHTVHLWRFQLTHFDETSFKGLLNSDELARADRFHFDKHKTRFTITRGLLRRVLSLYSHQAPERIRFKYGSRGKPYLENNPNHLQFNLSHSDTVAVLAVTSTFEMGVDIEKIENKYNEAIAKRFFSEVEYQELMTLPKDQQIEAFYQLWACKEALVKAVGEGLYISLGDFVVSSQKPSQWISLIYQQQEKRFYLNKFVAFQGYCSAFATNQHVDQLNYWEWQGDVPVSLTNF